MRKKDWIVSSLSALPEGVYEGRVEEAKESGRGRRVRWQIVTVRLDNGRRYSVTRGVERSGRLTRGRNVTVKVVWVAVGKRNVAVIESISPN